MRNKLSATLLFLTCLLGCGQLASHRPSAVPAARIPSQKWTIYPSGLSYHDVESVSSRYLWMKGGLWCGQIVRYDMQERKQTVFTDADGLPLSSSGVQRLVASEDGRCLLLLESEPQLFLYGEGQGWRRLPAVEPGLELQDVAFDSDGTPLLLANSRATRTGPAKAVIFRLAGKQWSQHRTSPLSASALVPLSDIYALKVSRPAGAKLMGVTKTGDSAPVELPGTLFDENRLKYFQLKGKTFMATPTPMDQPGKNLFPLPRAMQSVREITSEGIQERSDGRPQLLDLTTGTFEPFSIIWTAENKLDCAVAGASPWQMDALAGPSVFPIRDLNGDLWLGDRAFTGGQWRQTTRHVTRELFATGAVPTDKVYFNELKQQWTRRLPAEFVNFRIHATKAWAIRDYRDPMMLLLDISGEKPVVLREVPRQTGWGPPLFQDRQGAWWLLGSGVTRLAPDWTVKSYPLKSPPDLWLSPSGEIWTRDDTHILKYDPGSDHFVPSDEARLYDAFSFRLGGQEWSLLYLSNWLSCEALHRKVQGRWEVAATEAARWKDRMLLSTGGAGTWEYDAQRHCWVQLHSSYFHVGFDGDGRRILAGSRGVIVYDGDPFEDAHYRNWLPTGRPTRRSAPNLFEAAHPLSPAYAP